MRLGRRLRLERPERSVASAELSVLGLLHRKGPMSAGELARAERVQPQTLTRTLAALEQRGEIDRHPDPADRRRSVLSISQSGEAILHADVAQRDSWLALAMAEQLSPAETQLLMLAGELMERLADARAGALRRAASPRERPVAGAAQRRRAARGA
ncbi:MAG TPA: MarR family transcriptional regulator [Solirubrobacteraceae bacterium]|nr:MarR family transcriptional regulator [Solirubrobacteraceae bacterium]